MKKLLLSLAIVATAFFTSCSTDDSTPNTALAGENGFEFNRTAYTTDIIYVTPENDLVLSSRQLTNSDTMENINFARFSTQNGELSVSTYGVGNTLTHCTAVSGGDWTGSDVENGNKILGADLVTNGFLRVISLDTIDQTISILFEFERADGQLVAGKYVGNYERTEL